MEEKDFIKQLEYNFPKIFADYCEKDFGIMFYNQCNDDSHDSNHAIIYNSDDCEKTIPEIKQFYLNKGLSPRIYSALCNGQLENLKNALIKNGFTIEDYGAVDYLVWNGKCRIDEPLTLTFKRFTKNDDLSVFANIVEKDDILRTQKVVERRVLNPNYYMYIGYLNENPVVMASFQIDENRTARIDEVETAFSSRGKGYARQMTRFLTQVYQSIGGRCFYVWAANDTAQRIYEQGGFKMKHKFPHWSAYIQLNK